MVGPLHVFSSIYKLILVGVPVCFWFDLMPYRSLLLDLALPGIAWVLVCFIKLHPIFDVVQICGFVFQYSASCLCGDGWASVVPPHLV